MDIKSWAVLAGFVLLAGCSNNNEPATDGVQSETEIVEEAVPENALNHNRLFPQLAVFLETQDTAARDGYFLHTETVEHSAMALREQPQDTAALRPFRSLLVYNNDRTKVIDLFSYSHLVVKKGDSTELEGGEPDTEVAVVDLEKGTRRRIFFSGPSYSVMEGTWEGDSVVLLAVAERLQDDRVLPYIHRISLKDGSADLYRFSDTLRADLPAYITRRYHP